MDDRPYRVAVVGSGPAGFYAVGALLASDEPRFEVDLIERLPTPWGLVRLGVRVVDLEPGLLEAVEEVDRCALEVRDAVGIDHDRDAV